MRSGWRDLSLVPELEFVPFHFIAAKPYAEFVFKGFLRMGAACEVYSLRARWRNERSAGAPFCSISVLQDWHCAA